MRKISRIGKAPMKFKVDVNVISVENVPSKAERVLVSVARGPKMRTTKDAMLFNQESNEGAGAKRKDKKQVPRSFKTATWVRMPDSHFHRCGSERIHSCPHSGGRARSEQRVIRWQWPGLHFEMRA